MAAPQRRLIGVAGPSCCGKTTLASTVVEALPNATVIALDDYFKEELVDVPTIRCGDTAWKNWESPEAIDWKSAAAAVVQARAAAPIDGFVVVEGFLLFSTHAVAAGIVPDAAVVLSVDKDTVVARRILRASPYDVLKTYVPEDNPESGYQPSPGEDEWEWLRAYANDVLWPEAEVQIAAQDEWVAAADATGKQYVKLDGTAPLDGLREQARAFCRTLTGVGADTPSAASYL